MNTGLNSPQMGISYVAHGSIYINECMASIRSVRKVMPEIPICVYTSSPNSNLDSLGVEQVKISKDLQKVEVIQEIRFDITLYLDCDTFVMESLYELKHISENYDTAFCHAPWRKSPFSTNSAAGIPDWLPESNCGVLLLPRKEMTKNLLKTWLAFYNVDRAENSGRPPQDQPSFRRALFELAPKALVLPCEYNLRTTMPVFRGGGIRAKILHGRGKNLDRAIKGINEGKGVKTFNFLKDTSG